MKSRLQRAGDGFNARASLAPRLSPFILTEQKKIRTPTPSRVPRSIPPVDLGAAVLGAASPAGLGRRCRALGREGEGEEEVAGRCTGGPLADLGVAAPLARSPAPATAVAPLARPCRRRSPSPELRRAGAPAATS